MNNIIIVNKLNAIIQNLKNNNIINNFQQFIEDLHYIYFGLKNDQKQLSESEQFMYGTDIEDMVMEYFAELTKKYMKLKYQLDIEIEPTNEHGLGYASGGYNVKEDIIQYSSFGIIVGRTNHSSYLQTFLHESKHKMQHDSYKNDDILSIINSSSNIIFLAKEIVYQTIVTTEYKEFYMKNYNNLYTETDAEMFSLESLCTIILDIYAKNISDGKIKKLNKKDPLFQKMVEIHYELLSHSASIKISQKDYGRIPDNIIDEVYGRIPITSTYYIQDKEVDRLIQLDKTIKNHPEFQETMPILKLLFNGNVPKTYQEIIQDKQMLLATYPNETIQINKLYHNIILSDPILYLTDLVIKNQLADIRQFIIDHPTIFIEYTNEIKKIQTLTNNHKIIGLLTPDVNNKNRK